MDSNPTTRPSDLEQALTTPAPGMLAQLFGVGEAEIVPDEGRRRNALIFASIGLITLLIFGLANLLYSDEHRLHQLGWLQLAQAGVMLPILVLLQWGWNQGLIEGLLVLIGFINMVSNVIWGGRVGESVYWTFVFPYFVFFLSGQKVGWLVGMLYTLTVPALMAYSSRHWSLWAYSDALCLFYGLGFLFNVITAAYLNLLRSQFQFYLWKQVSFHTSEVRRHLAALQFNASHDTASGLLNRQGLIDALDANLQSRHGGSDYLLVASVRFFRVPELASIVGSVKVDESLRLLARRLQQELPGLVVLGRVGQDTLGIVLQSAHAGAESVRPLQAITHIRDAADLGEFSVHVEMAFGVVAQHPRMPASADVLMRNAEQALLFAIDNRLEYQFFDAALNSHFVDRNQRYEKLREAVLQNTLMLHYQPQLDLKTGKVVGAEALARWQDLQEGMIPPDRFIPIIESTGLLRRFSVWTVARALADCAAWQTYLPGVGVSINLSADALHEPEVLQTVQRHLASSGMTPSLVVIELTESVLLKAPDDALARMASFIALGVQLSIDDYGAGFSSLTYLKQLPAQEMKIDKSFINNLAAGAKEQAIVFSSIELGHDLGLKVLAEGIEDELTCTLLREAGCDLGQGWLFAKALPVAEFQAWSLERNAGVV